MPQAHVYMIYDAGITSPVGICSTKEKAQKALKKLPKTCIVMKIRMGKLFPDGIDELKLVGDPDYLK
jgi:hypothetical protein